MADGDKRQLLGPDGAVLMTPRQEVEELERALIEAVEDRRVAQKNADLFAYALLGYASQTEQDLPHKSRIKLVRQAREIWKKDAQAGASVRLFNDFVFGRGVPKPKCHDPIVQEVVDEAWDDPQNQRMLTSPEAQRTKGTDLAIQSNLFFLLFSGQDGKVKLGLLEHDAVDSAVRDSENRHRILFYKSSRYRTKWNFETHQEEREQNAIIEYFPAWANVAEAEEEGVSVPQVPTEFQGKGEVFHVAINRTSEMVFGHPEMHRVVQWYAAFNEFMASRVDLTKAQAAIWMKRKVKGGEAGVMRMAQQQVTRRSDLSASEGGSPVTAPSRVAGILTENEAVSHEPFSFNTQAGNAAQDGDMLHSQMAAATGWPKHYTGGDAGALAGATALELPVLKLVESRQEVFESVFRWFIDRVIERAVETGRIARVLDPSELTEAAQAARRRRLKYIAATEKPRLGEQPEAYMARVSRIMELAEAHEDRAVDEAETQRDLGYEFSMPNPLRRSQTDVASVIETAAKTFDPNGTNIELTRMLFGLYLTDVLEVENAQEAIDKVFPEDYVDPAMAQFQQPPAPPEQQQGNTGADGQQHTEDNAYGAPRQATAPEDVQEGRYEELPEDVRKEMDRRFAEVEGEFMDEVWGVIELGTRQRALSANGNGRARA